MRGNIGFLAFLATGIVALGWVLAVQTRPLSVSLELSDRAPLAAEAVIRTSDPSTVRVEVKEPDGAGAHGTPETGPVSAVFDRPSRMHVIPVLGLYPGRENEVRFLVTTSRNVTYRIRKTLRTNPLPEWFPEFEVRTHATGSLAGGMLFLHLGGYDDEMNYYALPCAVDGSGTVRWRYDGDNGHLLRRLRNGNLIIQNEDSIVEIDMLGRPAGNSWRVPGVLHHDAVEMPNGNFLALTSAEGSYYDAVVEIDRRTGEVSGEWDFREILDPDRPVQPANLGEEDWLHLNAVVYDEEDDAIIVSGRDQSAVVKVDRASGELVWILGNHEKWSPEFRPFLLEPEGLPFLWPWGQHAPMLHPGDNSRLLLFDNGNKRSYDEPLPPEENFSRAVEYLIDEEEGTVRQLWQYGREHGSELYTPCIGDADYLREGNRLVCFGGITRDLRGRPVEIFDFEKGEVNEMKISARIFELTADSPARVLREVIIEDDDPDSYRGYRSYRAELIPLYPRRYRPR